MPLNKQQELLNRLKNFARDCAKYASSLSKNQVNLVYGGQLIRSSSSMPANYAESMCAMTRQDWIYDINKCRKEGNESEVWLDLLVEANLKNQIEGKRLRDESKELVAIFSKTVKSARLNTKTNELSRHKKY